MSDLFTPRGDLAIDTTFANASRRALDDHSWVEVVPDWITGSEQLFDLLAPGVPWKQHYRRLYDQNFLEPRLTAEYRSVADVPPALGRSDRDGWAMPGRLASRRAEGARHPAAADQH